jgi:hypothetical protein
VTRLILADASKVTPREFFDAVFPKPEGQHVAAVRSYLGQGKVDEARAYLEAVNRINRAFGFPEVELPGDLQLTDVAGDPMLRKDAA